MAPSPTTATSYGAESVTPGLRGVPCQPSRRFPICAAFPCRRSQPKDDEFNHSCDSLGQWTGHCRGSDSGRTAGKVRGFVGVGNPAGLVRGNRCLTMVAERAWDPLLPPAASRPRSVDHSIDGARLRTPPVPPVVACRYGAVPRRRRDGVTLLELVVALTLLGIAAAFTLPSFLWPREATPTLDAVALYARERAIARAQPLILAVDADGRWTLTASTADRQSVDSGRVASPGSALAIEVSPLGRCLVHGAAPAVSSTWDVARCTSGRRS